VRYICWGKPCSLEPRDRNNLQKEKRCKKKREQQEVQINQGEKRPPSESSFPSPVTSAHPFSKEHIMAKDRPQRMTLEDYSSSATPQYFTNIARLNM